LSGFASRGRCNVRELKNDGRVFILAEEGVEI
jgi:hypothetical protein